MGTIVVTMSLTLDGVIQSPGRPDEDTRGGFEHGGWAVPYGDAVQAEYMAKGMAKPGVILLGRRTYQGLYDYWPKQTDGNPYTAILDNTQKYVASRTLTEPLPWVNSTLLSGDAVEAVAKLRADATGTIAVIGSGDLVRQLARHGLVDEYTLQIYPLVLGTGTRLFPAAGTFAKLRLVDSVTTTTGVIIATYQPREVTR